MHPEDLKYTAEHEWVRVTGPDTVRFGITAFAEQSLGDIVYVSLPAVGDPVTAGQPCGEVESTKSVSELYAPIDGTVVARNDGLEEAPETVNADPYGDAWMVELQVVDPAQLDHLLDAAAYGAHLAEL